LKRITIILLIVLLTQVMADGNSVTYNSESKKLSYLIDYNRLLANAEAQNCSEEAFRLGLLHSVLNNIFLFLPYESSFHDDVKNIEVVVIKSSESGAESLVLKAASSLAAIEATNQRFRVFMNGFASTNSGYCFAVSQETTKVWLDTLFARGGELVYNKKIIDLELPDLIRINGSVEDLDKFDMKSIVPAGLISRPDSQDEPAPQEVVEAKEKEKISILGQDYYLLPFLTNEPVRQFESALDVLEPNQDYYATVETSKGTLLLDLFEDKTPKTVNNFVFLAQNHFYDGLAFFNVIDNFVAQVGSPSDSIVGGPGYVFDDEIYTGFSHSEKGIVSMVNSGPNSNGSQFFITLGPTPRLDRQNAIFAKVVAGIEVLDILQRTELAEPLAVATLDSSLGLLQIQGISLAGNEDMSFEDYIISKNGRLPKDGVRTDIDDYSFVLGKNPQSNIATVSFYAKVDIITGIHIIQKIK